MGGGGKYNDEGRSVGADTGDCVKVSGIYVVAVLE